MSNARRLDLERRAEKSKLNAAILGLILPFVAYWYIGRTTLAILAFITGNFLLLGHIIAPFHVIWSISSARREVGYSSSNTRNQTSSGSRKSASFSGYDHSTIESGQFIHYSFDISEASILKYNVEVFNGPPVNVILTNEKNLSRFRHTQDIKWLESGSRREVRDANVKTRIQPGKWVIILDNTHRGWPESPEKPVNLEFEYEVYS